MADAAPPKAEEKLFQLPSDEERLRNAKQRADKILADFEASLPQKKNDGSDAPGVRKFKNTNNDLDDLRERIFGPPGTKDEEIYLLGGKFSQEKTSKAVEDVEKLGDLLDGTGDLAIERLFRLDVHLARQDLFEDYFRMAYIPTDRLESVNDRLAKTRQHVARYGEYSSSSFFARLIR